MAGIDSIRKTISVIVNLSVAGAKATNDAMKKMRTQQTNLLLESNNYQKVQNQVTKQRDIQIKRQIQGANILNKSLQNQNKINKQSIQVQRNNEMANQGFGRTIRMNQQEWSNFNKQGGKFNTMGGKMANRLRMMTHGLRGFRMEMLGIMFFGMSIARVTSGLIKKSIEWMGVSDVLSSALGMLFLPIAEKLLDWALKFLDWVDQLTPSEKKIINMIVAIVTAIGGLLTIIGTVGLGIGSVIQAFGFLFGRGLFSSIFKAGGLFKWFGSIITGIGTTFLAVSAIVTAVLIGMYLAWKENFMGMKDILKGFIQGIKLFFKGLVQVFSGVFMIISGIFSGNFEKMKEGFIKLLKGFGNLILGVVQIIINASLAITVGVLRLVVGIIQSVVNGVIWLANKVNKLLGGKGKTINKVDWVESLKNVDMKPLVNMPSFKTGGIMPHTGPAFLHKGEKIIPEHETKSTMVPSINITANVSSDYDVRRLADELKRYWVSDFERASKGRSI